MPVDRSIPVAQGPIAWLRVRLLPRRLDRQIILLASLLLGLVVPLFAFNAAHQDARRVVESTTLQAKVLARNVAVSSIAHLLTHDFSATEQILLRAARFPGVREIQVADATGRVLGDVLVGPRGNPVLRYEPRTLRVPVGARVIHDNADALVIWEPIASSDAVGWVRLVYDLTQAEQIAQRRLYDHLTEGAVLAIMLIALILLVMRRPLRLLRDAAGFATRLKDMHGEHLALERSSIEIEQLGLALNEAAANLVEQDRAIKQAMQALGTQKSAMDEHSIVSITDVKGNITYANPKLLEVMGYELDEVLGRNHRMFRSGLHDAEFYRDLWSTIAAGRVWHGDILNHGKHGRNIWLNTTIVPFMDDRGRPYEFVAIRTDITQRKRAEKELQTKAASLKAMAENLDHLVQQRTAELEAANEELLHLNRIKSEFVSVVSHELRTPLTAIKSFAEILEDDIEELDVESQKSYLGIINQESDRLGRLINDLLDLQKMDAGKTVWKAEPTDLAALLHSATVFFMHAFADKNLDLKLRLDPGTFVATVDSDRIRQLLTNLLSNALKFTDRGGVTVTIGEVFRNDTRMAEVCIADTGIGIPEDELTTVFDHFHQVDSSDTREKGGSGLGLAICKQIVEHHRGRIWAESSPGEGSRFLFTLPLDSATAGDSDTISGKLEEPDHV